MSLHPLRQEYIDQVWAKYHQYVRGDTTPEKTELAAVKIHALGMPFELFIDLALRTWDSWAKKNGMPYPYWNVVIGPKSIERMKELIRYADVTPAEDKSGELEDELGYATEYVQWMLGQAAARPVREKPVDPHIRTEAARYLCHVYGVDYSSPNYNDIAMKLRSNGH